MVSWVRSILLWIGAVGGVELPSLDELGVKVVVLHLERAADRHAPLVRSATEQGVSFELMQASDGMQERFRSAIFPSRHPEAS